MNNIYSPELTFQLAADGKALVACVLMKCTQPVPSVKVAPHADTVSALSPPLTPWTVERIRSCLIDKGLGDHWIDEAVVEELVADLNKIPAAKNWVMGERRDGDVEIIVNIDKMQAYAQMKPPQGGIACTIELFKRRLSQEGVIFGLKDEVIQQLLAPTAVFRADPVMIAVGQPCEPGTLTEFRSLLPNIVPRCPQVNAQGRIDYRDLGQLTIVNAGEALMRRIPPVQGLSGKNVLGQDIPSKVLLLEGFDPKLTGTVVDPLDSNLLRAALNGQPVLLQQGISVDPCLKIAKVDLSTGHINFDGAVHIQGDVAPGMKIKSNGDVHIDGVVEAATIEAKGHIHVKGGVIGHKDSGAHLDASAVGQARLIAQGSIHVLFADQAVLQAQKDIFVDEFTLNCTLNANNSICVGKPGAKKGCIVGGLTVATQCLKAMELGSSTDLKTEVIVGVKSEVLDELDDLRQVLDAKQKICDDLKKIIQHIVSHRLADKIELLRRSETTLKAESEDIINLTRRKTELTQILENAKQASLTVEKTIHSGCSLKLGSHAWNFIEPRGYFEFHLVDGELIGGVK